MKKRLFFLAGIIVLTSCENELSIEVSQPEMDIDVVLQDDFVPNEEAIQLGEQLENPYSLDNMRKAFAMLSSETRSGLSVDDITPTHLYIKFKPADADELDALLWENDDIDFYTYPLDYECSSGSYYRDPDLPNDVPTYHYASIPIGRQIPNECKYEVLEELYIPDESTEYTRTLAPTFINALVKQAFEITGNEYTADAIATRGDGNTRASYTYSGTIRAWDDFLGQCIPVPGVVMKCTRWFTTVKAITNANGVYTMTRESTNKYKYAIYWERDNKYDIRAGDWDQAVTGGPEQTSGWSIDMKKEDGYRRAVNYAAINRAAYRYFFGNTGGLERLSTPDTGDLKICYIHDEPHEEGWLGYFDSTISFEITGDIWIYSKNGDGYWQSTDRILSTSAHEMGHANQCFSMQTINYIDVDKFIKESWASFVQAYLSYLEYGERGKYNLNNFSFEDYCTTYGVENNLKGTLRWPTYGQLDYSCMFIDLFDDFNQYSNWSTQMPNDIITGYSPSILNSLINQCYDLYDVRIYLKANKPNGVSDAMIDNLLDFYIANK